MASPLIIETGTDQRVTLNDISEFLAFDVKENYALSEIAIPSMAFPFEVILDVRIPFNSKLEFVRSVGDLIDAVIGTMVGVYSTGETCFFVYNKVAHTLTILFPHIQIPLTRQSYLLDIVETVFDSNQYLQNRFGARNERPDGLSRVWLGGLDDVRATWIFPVAINKNTWFPTMLFRTVVEGEHRKNWPSPPGRLNAGSGQCRCFTCLNQCDVECRDSDSGVYEALCSYTKLVFLATKLWSDLAVPYVPRPMHGLFDDIDIRETMLKMHPTTVPMNTLQDEETRKTIFLPCLKAYRFQIEIGNADRSFDALKLFLILGKDLFNTVRRARFLADLTIEEENFLALMNRDQELNLTYMTVMYYASRDDPQKFNTIIGKQILGLYLNGICVNNLNMIWQALSYRLLGTFYSYMAPASTQLGYINTFFRFSGSKLVQEPNIDAYITTSLTSGDLRALVDELAILVLDAAKAINDLDWACTFTEFSEATGTHVVTDTLNNMVRNVIRSNINGPKIANVVKGMKTNLNHIASIRCKFDSNPSCFGVENGVLYTVTVDEHDNSQLLFRPCEPEDYVTKFSQARYDLSLVNNANYQTLERRLHITFPDPQVYSWALSYFAGCFRGVPPKIAMFLHGGPNTGKTSLSSLMSHTLGNSYTSPLGCDYFTQTRTDTSKPNPAVISAVRGRLTTIEEFKGTINCEVFKEKTGGRTRVNERTLYQGIDEGGTVSMTRFLFISNSIPVIRYDPAAIHRIGLITLSARYIAAKAITTNGEGYEEVNNLSDQYRRMKDEMLMLLVNHFNAYRSSPEAKFCDLENVPDQMKAWRMAVIADSSIYSFLTRNVRAIPAKPGLTLALHDLANIMRTQEPWKNETFADMQSEIISILQSFDNYNGIIGWNNLVFFPSSAEVSEEYIDRMYTEYAKCNAEYPEGFCLPAFRQKFSRRAIT